MTQSTLLRRIKRHTPEGVKHIARRMLAHSAAIGRGTPKLAPSQVEHHKLQEILEIQLSDAYREAIKNNNWLSRYAKNITSQGGEDGIISKILEVIGVNKPGWCVEFGACDGKQDSNTWNLITNEGWSGVLIEPAGSWHAELERNYGNRSDVYRLNRFVNWEGPDRLDNIFAETPLPKDFELLVVDIDGNDAHVFEAMDEYKPHVVSIEFHRLIHPSVRFTPPKDFSLNWSASLGALYDLAKSKGYELVCVIYWNAFFVRRDHFSKFNIKDNRPEKMQYAAEEMRIFQGYDGTLHLFNNTTLYWKYQLDTEGNVKNLHISHNDIQVLPDSLRVFRPRHTYHCETMANQAGKLEPQRVPGNKLLAKRRNVTSECGEDGILEWIFNTLGVKQGYAVDVGACDGKWNSQTWNLFANSRWKGLAIEKDAVECEKLSQAYATNPEVRCLREEVTYSGPASLNEIFAKYKAPQEIHFLRIGVEGNDYYVWRSLTSRFPDVVSVEFNPGISNDVFYVQAYNTASPAGCSLKALVGLAKTKSYELAAVTDWNAIFVRKDLFSRLGIQDNDIDSMYYPPFEMRMTQTMDGYLHLFTGNVLFRQDYAITPEDFQVLPASMRRVYKAFGGTPILFYGEKPEYK